MQRLILPLVAALLVSAVSGSARAYCQTYTCEFDSRETCHVDARTGCKSGGEIAHWGSDCITYAIQADGSPGEGITATQLKDLVASGFDAWTKADCSSVM